MLRSSTLTTKPRSKYSSDERQQTVEVGDRLGNNPTDEPANCTDTHPASNALEVLLVDHVRALPDAHVDVLACYTPVDNASDDDGRQGDTEGDLANKWGSRAESW